GVIDAGEDYVKQDQPRRMRVAGLGVVAGDGGEQRYGQAQGAFAAGGRAGQRAPLTVPALDAEAVPAAIVECACQLFVQAAALVGVGAAAFGGDALLQHFADYAAVLDAPQIGAGVEQALAGGLEADRGAAIAAFGQGLPQQPEAHAGGGRALGQFFVDRQHLLLGVAQQLVDGAGDFGLQVVLQHLSFAGGQQFPALRDFAGQARAQLVGALGPVLVDDADDQAEIAGF